MQIDRPYQILTSCCYRDTLYHGEVSIFFIFYTFRRKKKVCSLFWSCCFCFVCAFLGLLSLVFFSPVTKATCFFFALIFSLEKGSSWHSFPAWSGGREMVVFRKVSVLSHSHLSGVVFSLYLATRKTGDLKKLWIEKEKTWTKEEIFFFFEKVGERSRV